MHSELRIPSGQALLATTLAGNGAPVVFLHAGICDRRMWRPQMEAAAAGNKAIAYDRRGFGESRGQAEDHSAVADLLHVLDAAADGAPAILVGCSQGGRIALDAALLHPSRVRGLVLIAPTVAGAPAAVYPPGIRPLMDRMETIEAAGDLDQINAFKARLFLDGPLSPEGRVQGEIRERFLDMNGIALRAAPAGASRDAVAAFQRLDEIRVPSMVLWGSHDFPHIQERSRQVAGMLMRGSGHALAGAAHLPSLEQPEIVSQRILELIARCAG